MKKEGGSDNSREVEQGKYGLWYADNVGYATKEQAEAALANPNSLSHLKVDTPAIDVGSLSAGVASKDADSKKFGIIGWLFFALFIAVFFVMFSKSEDQTAKTSSAAPHNNAQLTEVNLQKFARDFVNANLKDKSSAEFRNQKGVCGEVNAKNSFGGYTGFKRFIAANKELVIMDGDPALAPGAFQEVWVKFCS